MDQQTRWPLSPQQPPSAKQKTAAEAIQLRRFARQYLEKLINIEVPVPTAPLNQSLGLLTSHAAQTNSSDKWIIRTRKILRNTYDLGRVAAIATVFTFVTLWYGGDRFEFAVQSIMVNKAVDSLVRGETAALAAFDRAIAKGADPEEGLAAAIAATESVDPFPSGIRGIASSEKNPTDFITSLGELITPSKNLKTAPAVVSSDRLVTVSDWAWYGPALFAGLVILIWGARAYVFRRILRVRIIH